jgi:hypothetical protein
MVRGEIVKRSWSKKSQISEHTDILDIWDTGSHIFERWPNGDEYYWRVISREEFNNGFIEILEKQPPWQVPSQVLRREQIPLLQMSTSHFQMGGWSVEQEVEKTSSIQGVRNVQEHSVQAHRPQGHTYKKNTSLQRAQPKSRGQQEQQAKVRLLSS